MACCQTAPSHYINQYWLFITKVRWHSSTDNMTKIPQPSVTKISLKSSYIKFNSNLPGANELILEDMVKDGCYQTKTTHNKAWHYSDVIMGTMASQITNLTIVYSTIYSDTAQRKHQSSTSMAFVKGIHRRRVNSPHKRPVTRKMFPFDDIIMNCVHNSWDVLYLQ